ncbi:porin family protein [Chitinophaga nivalis]|uniref:PorT family protein n=1 Tax=Chitinophaga nivalis TaxID=2991709 RepID=A0ABT3IJE6_9BACT|nr:porin family protein [Chitinophaga nivalis]MCW3466227.1 PorT family protein [Chitinophaga nivalis]MCW3484082.1 PorT family protein [Chitinophaga nivalis]
MKKPSLLLLLTLITLQLSFPASAQKIHYGLKAELNMFNVEGKGISASYNPGGRLGVFAIYDFARHWGIQPELLVTQAVAKRGDNFSTYYVNGSNPDAKKNAKLSYITIPILFRYNLNEQFTFNAGPQYSLLFYDNENFVRNNRSAFKRNDVGIVAGVTFNLDNVHFSGRYVYGFSDVNNIDDRYEWKTRQIQLGVGVTLR